MYFCCVCSGFASQKFAFVLRHMKTHEKDPGLKLVCPISECDRKRPYTNYESYRSHINRKHPFLIKRSLNRTGSDPDCDPDEPAEVEQDSEFSDEENEEDEHEEAMETSTDDSDRSSLQFAAAHFLLKTREERRITQRATDGIVKDMTDLWEKAIEQV